MNEHSKGDQEITQQEVEQLVDKVLELGPVYASTIVRFIEDRYIDYNPYDRPTAKDYAAKYVARELGMQRLRFDREMRLVRK